MRHERTNVNNGKQVVLKFTREKGDPALDDDFVQTTLAKEKLKPVSKEGFEDYCRKELGRKNPKTKLVMFGNFGRDDSEAHFAGMMYLDTDSKVKVIANWTRGASGKEWGDGWEFLLAPAS